MAGAKYTISHITTKKRTMLYQTVKKNLRNFQPYLTTITPIHTRVINCARKFISYFLFHSNKHYIVFPFPELPTPEDVYHTPPLTEHYDTNEGSEGSGYIHGGPF
jgi:hypothetical protein